MNCNKCGKEIINIQKVSCISGYDEKGKHENWLCEKCSSEWDKEIERLKAENKRLSEKLGQILLSIDTVKEMNAMCNIDEQRKQAVKEFAEEIKPYIKGLAVGMDGEMLYVLDETLDKIDELLEEYEK